jgi:phosphoribosylformylglycinamidine synthase
MGAPETWGKPLAALLGAWWAQVNLGTPAIGGKDSMSGSFENIHVPPTLVSFALCVGNTDSIISPELKQAGNGLYRARISRDESGMPDFENVKAVYAKIYELIKTKRILSAYAVERGGVLSAVAKMALGSEIGAALNGDLDDFTNKAYGDIILEGSDLPFERIGETGTDSISLCGESVALSDVRQAYEATLSGVYPVLAAGSAAVPDMLYESKNIHVYSGEKAKPRIVIPVFPGTNCEYDSAAAFARAGGLPEVFVMRNIFVGDIDYSIDSLAKLVHNSQILMLPGGFSGGDEPDGSCKFITAVLRAPKVKKAVEGLLARDGLILGICNGFQALIKTGLVPYGEIRDTREDSPTLTFNTIGRHVSRMVRTRISSNASPWLSLCKPGDVHSVAVSHGEGRFVASEAEAMSLYERGQIATQYVDEAGLPTMGEGNPNGSMLAVEGLLSPDGRVFGKMAHCERFVPGNMKNIPGDKDQRIFEAGVRYFL